MKIREFIEEIQVLEAKAEFASKFSYLLDRMMHTTRESNPAKWKQLYDEAATASAEYEQLLYDNKELDDDDYNN